MPLLFAGIALVAGQAAADEPVHITNVIFNGSGCPNGGGTTVQLYDFDRDGLPEQFEMFFTKDYIAEQGPGLPISQRRRNCAIAVSLHVPDGHQFSVAHVVHTGYADLPWGIRGTQRTDYDFPFHADAVSLETVIDGLFKNYYWRQDDPNATRPIWSPCGLGIPLSIRTQVYMEGDPGLPAAMTLDRLLPSLIWRRCETAKDRATDAER
jgi:hypothetical protein